MDVQTRVPFQTKAKQIRREDIKFAATFAIPTIITIACGLMILVAHLP